MINWIKKKFIKNKFPEPSHIDILEEKIKLIKNTIKFPKFMYWVINDPDYGLELELGRTYGKISLLYQEWIDSGIKPHIDKWSNITYNLTHIIEYDLATCATDPDYACILINDFAIKCDSNTLLGIKIIQEAQIIKLNELINEDELFTEEDYNKE